jgi:hypothetical protein
VNIDTWALAEQDPQMVVIGAVETDLPYLANGRDLLDRIPELEQSDIVGQLRRSRQI